jgi:glycine/D-amino acid oxidase-like deaminating enzyme
VQPGRRTGRLTPGSFLIARTGVHKEHLRTEARQSLAWGADVLEVDPRAVSYFQPGDTDLALWCPGDIYVEEPAELVRAYVAAGRRHGVRLLEHEGAIAITVSGGRVHGVETSRRTLTTPAVVDAAGAWTARVAELAGGRVAVAPVRHQPLITAVSEEVNPADPIIRVVDAAVYLRPARGGLFTMSPDGRFVTGPVPDIPGLWVASGCNGSGFSSSLALGAALAGWIFGSPDRMDISALSPARFGAVSDDALVAKGVWQYAHYYDPVTEPGGHGG